jgi:hypothetical protein
MKKANSLLAFREGGTYEKDMGGGIVDVLFSGIRASGRSMGEIIPLYWNIL